MYKEPLKGKAYLDIILNSAFHGNKSQLNHRLKHVFANQWGYLAGKVNAKLKAENGNK